MIPCVRMQKMTLDALTSLKNEQINEICERCNIEIPCDFQPQHFAKIDNSEIDNSKQNPVKPLNFTDFCEITKISNSYSASTRAKKHNKANLSTALSFGQFVEMTKEE